MYEIERAIPTPQVEIIVQRRARRQVFRDGPPLTTGGENIHEAIHNLAHDHCAFVAAAPAWRDQRFDQLPFVVGEVAGIAQWLRSYRCAISFVHIGGPVQNQATSLES